MARLSAFFLSVFFASSLCAQQAALVGRIEDVSGRIILGALVQVLNKDTGSSRRCFTDADGFFSLPALLPGMYDLDVSADGFRRSMRTDVDLHSAQTARVDFTLQVGSLSQTVTVTAENSGDGVYGAGNLLDNAAASGSTVIDRTLVSSLPLLGSNPFSLISLTGGSSHLSAFPDHLSERPFDNGGMDGYSINGGPAGGNNNGFLLEGAPNNTNEGLGFVPSSDAVREVNVVKNAYDASYGRTGGGITSVGIKSGSTSFHGVARYQLRDTAMNANLTQLNAAGQRGAPYSWDEPGLELDGPLGIPHLYSNSHPTYFLASWDEIHDSITASASQNYPTALERTGNFSQTLGANGGPIMVFDPVTTSATGVRTAFPGGVLPASRIDPLMARLTALFPLPNVSCAPRGCANFVGSSAVSDAYDAALTRVDHDISQNEKLFIMVEHGDRHELHMNPGGGDPATLFAFPSYGTFRSNAGASANLTSVLSPTLVSTSSLSWLRHNGNGLTGGGNGFDPSRVGFTPGLASLFGAMNLPAISFGGSAVNYTGLGTQGGGSPGSYSTTYNTNWTASNTLIQTKHRHTMKIGGLTTITLQNSYVKSTIPGITFGDVFTRSNYLQSDPNSGDAIATALLGYPTGGSYTNPILPAYATRYYAVFVQDDWRATNSLTFSVGMRWDYQSPATERYNRAVTGFDPAAVSNIGSTQVNGRLVYADAARRSPYQARLNEFQPRLGVAYAFSRKVVFRGGWGRSYVQGYPFAPTTGFSATTNIMASSDGTNRVPTLVGDSAAGLSANGFAQLYGSGLIPLSGSPGALSGAGTQISFVNPNYRNPFVDGFNAGFDVYLPWGTLLHAEYNGSRGHQLPVSKPLDVLTRDQFLSLGTSANTPLPNPFAGLLPGTSMNSSMWTLGQSLLPDPQFAGINETNNPVGQLWYNSLQIRLDKHLSHGVALFSNYTWAKNLGGTDYMNPNFDSMSALRKALTSIDQPQLLNIAIAWQLPMLRSGTGLIRGLVSGWTLAGSAQFQSGSVVNAPAGVFSTGVDPTKPDSYWQGPNLQRWFNTCTITTSGTRQNCLGPGEPAAWIMQPSFTLNNLSPRFADLRNARPPSASVSISKIFALKDKINLQLRGDVFNLTNTPWFGAGDNGAGVNATASSAAFGSVTFAQGNDPRTVQIGARFAF